MPVVATHLTTGFSETDASSYVTASISPTGNSLVLVWVQYRASVGPSVSPTLSGNGITWVEEDVIADSGNANRISLFRGLVASPSAGAVTIDFAGATQLRCLWSIVEYANVDTSGTNGSGAVLQSVTANDETTNTSLTITLAAFGSVNNATAGGVRKGVTITEGAGFTEQGEAGDATSGFIESEFRNDNDTSVDWSWASSGTTAQGIAVEIKAAGAAAVVAGGYGFIF